MAPIAVLFVLLSSFLHAGWNLLAHQQRVSRTFFLRLLVTIGVGGVVPIAVGHVLGGAIPARTWGLAAISGVFLSFYFLGLTMGYRNGEFSLVYPMARALPVALLAVMDLVRGHVPGAAGWAGIALVMAGCFLVAQAPGEEAGEEEPNRGRVGAKTMGWILLITLATTGYSAVDKLAADHLETPGPWSAAQYGAMQFACSVPLLWLMLRWLDGPLDMDLSPGQWKWPAAGAAMNYVAYWLVLWAYQLSPFGSYVLALRQFSIALGTAGAIVLLKERVRPLRLGAVGLLIGGVVMISLAR